MNDTIAYEWTEEMARCSLSASCKEKVGRPSFFLVGGAVLVILGLVGCFQDRTLVPLIVSAIGLFVIRFSIRIRSEIQHLAKDAALLFMDDIKVSVTISDESLTVFSANSSRTIAYTKFTRIRERDGFLLFYSGKLLVALLPKVAFDAKHIAFLKTKISSTVCGPKRWA